jgi:hypothetical protein
MAQKPTDLQSIPRDVLEKENTQLKKELANLTEGRKYSSLAGAVLQLMIYLMGVSYFAVFAEYGGQAFTVDNNLGVLGGALLLVSLVGIGYFLKLYVIAMFIFEVITIFKEEILIGARRVRTFILAGRKAVLDAIEKEEQAEEPVQQVKEQPTSTGERNFMKTPTDKDTQKKSGHPKDSVKTQPQESTATSGSDTPPPPGQTPLTLPLT